MKVLASIAALALLVCLDAVAEEWSGFRGPHGTGVATTGDFPDKLDPDYNLAWKITVPKGKSSPVIVADRVLFTGHEGEQRFVLCHDLETGSRVWKQALTVDQTARHNKLNDAASPSLSSDGERVFAFFADFGLVAYTLDGDEIWKVSLGPFSSQHGMASSPVYSAGKVFLLADHMDGSYLAAFDARNGETLWRTSRDDYIGSYSTPAVHGEQIITVGPGELASYAIDSGEKLWWVSGLPFQAKSLPVVGQDVVYINVKGAGADGSPGSEANFTKYVGMFDKNENGLIDLAEAPGPVFVRFIGRADKDGDRAVSKQEWDAEFEADRQAGALRAIQLGGRGDVTDTHEVWHYGRSMANVPSPLLYQGEVYSLRNGGILTALDAATGEVVKQGRLRDAIDSYYASPVAADGKIYALSETGKLTVIRAGESWEVLGTVELGESAYASPALSAGNVVVRTTETLYRFGPKRAF